MLQQKNLDIFSNLKVVQYKRVRKNMVGAILATDMAEHFKKLGGFKTAVLDENFDASTDDNKLLVCEFLFHVADISNSSKPFDLCRKWTDLLFVEFFNQGDNEKKNNFPVSMFMDRTTTNIAQSQVGFIDFIQKPTFQASTLFLPEVQRCYDALEVNKASWEGLIPEYIPKATADPENIPE